MNREDLILWLKFTTNNGENWPRTTRYVSPSGWKWIISCQPYQEDEIKLISLDLDDIVTKEDMVE